MSYNIKDELLNLESLLSHEGYVTRADTVTNALARIEELEAKLIKAMETLRFYSSATVEYQNSFITFQPGDDRGQRAQTTLAELKDE